MIASTSGDAPVEGRDVLFRIERGFIERRTKLKMRSATNKGTDHPNALTGNDSTRREQRRSIDLRSLSQRFLRKEISLSQYITYMRSLLPEQYHDLIVCYFFSGEYVAHPEELIARADVDDEELSILCQTLVLANRIKDKDIVNLVEKELVELTAVIYQKTENLSKIDSFDAFRALTLGMGWCGPAPSINTLSDFNQYMGSVKGDLVHMVGPDLFTVFQQLCDPEAVPSVDQIDQYFRVCRLWRCSDLFAQLLLIRATRGAASDDVGLRAFAKSSISKSPHGISDNLISLYKSWLSSRLDSAVGEKGSPREALRMICSLRASLGDGEPSELIDQVLRLYNMDSSLMEWIDWGRIYDALRNSVRQEGLQSSAIHLLMGQPYVGRKFPVVVFAEGDGAFESSLRTAIGKFSDKSIEFLCTELAGIPGNSKALLVEALLHPDTAATLAFLLQHSPPWARPLTQARLITYDVRASALRFDLATTLARHELLGKERAQSIVEEEQTRLRVSLLQGKQLDGLVFIEWTKIAEYLDTEFAGQIALVRQMASEPALRNPASYVRSVASALAERVVDLILVDGPDNIKTTISDSLRHGQIRNRFLIAFDRAILTAANTPLDTATLIGDLVSGGIEDGLWLVNLRAQLITRIKEFNSECLTVWAPSAFKKKVIRAVEETLMSMIKPDAEQSAVSICLPLIKDMLSDFLSDARQQLKIRISDFQHTTDKIAASADDKNFRLPGQEPRVFDKHRFFLALREQLSDARDEALPWIALTQSSQDPQDFTYNDLVQLCLLNHRSESSRQPNVVARVSERTHNYGIVLRNDNPLLVGRYFGFLETAVKNLLANAFTHSGLGFNTRITIELILGRELVTLRCRNTLSAARYRNLKENLTQIQQTVNNQSLAAAGDDTNSGFHKVRWAFHRALAKLPAVRLSLAPQAVLQVSVQAQFDGSILVEKNSDR